MRRILLINPNSSMETTSMMVDIAAGELSDDFEVVGTTARNGPRMIVDEAALSAAAPEVERCWREAGDGWHGVIVGAFGDPGLEQVRAACRVPVVGLCEASMLEAAQAGRRFGVATITPQLAASIAARAVKLELGAFYTGIRLTPGEPEALARDPLALTNALASAVAHCIDRDGAQAVIIGGGPLGQAAIELSGRFPVPVIAPISAALRLLRRQLT